MAARAKLTITVTASRNYSTISYSTGGTYKSLIVGDVQDLMNLQPVLTTSGSKAFWEAALPLVLADITAGHGGGS